MSYHVVDLISLRIIQKVTVKVIEWSGIHDIYANHCRSSTLSSTAVAQSNIIIKIDVYNNRDVSFEPQTSGIFESDELVLLLTIELLSSER